MLMCSLAARCINWCRYCTPVGRQRTSYKHLRCKSYYPQKGQSEMMSSIRILALHCSTRRIAWLALNIDICSHSQRSLVRRSEKYQSLYNRSVWSDSTYSRLMCNCSRRWHSPPRHHSYSPLCQTLSINEFRGCNYTNFRP